MKRGFVDKFIENLGRLNLEDIRAHLLRIIKEKGFLETIFNALQEGIVVTDLKGRIIYLNDAAQLLFGLQESSLGKLLSDQIRGLDWLSLVDTKNVVSRDIEIFYPSNRYLNFYVVPLDIQKQKNDGEEIGYALIVKDITESKRNTEQTIENEKISAVALLAAGVAHEIGNALNPVHIHLQLIERALKKMPAHDKRADVEEWIRVAKDEIRRLDFIVTQFLKAVRPTTLQTSSENINDIVQESVSFLTAETQNRDILIELDLADRMPPLEVDRDQLKQAFYNVIKNSYQAMHSGGILRIRTHADDDYITVAFVDNGGGISPENLSKVFDPYFTTKVEGSGLGLLIVRRIIRAHGGEIELQSIDNQGLVFTIRLPRYDRQVRMLALTDAAL